MKRMSPCGPMEGFNILVTGTPGVGKSSFCIELAQRLEMDHVDVGKLIKDQKLYTTWDDEMNCSIFDEDKVYDALQQLIEEGGKIIDFHSCDFLEDHWFAAVFVLRTSNTVLYDRLEKRGYSPKKIQENVECEIFRVVLDEALSCFDESTVKEMQNDSMTDFEANLDAATALVRDLREAE